MWGSQVKWRGDEGGRAAEDASVTLTRNDGCWLRGSHLRKEGAPWELGDLSYAPDSATHPVTPGKSLPLAQAFSFLICKTGSWFK